MLDLLNYFRENKGRGIAKYEHYFKIYDRYLSKFVDKEMNFLEIGIGEGGALQMWKNYFGPQAKIFGFDIHNLEAVNDDQIKTFVGDQGDQERIEELKGEIPPLDVIIDDGSHFPRHQIVSFEGLFSHLKEGGIYLIEDCNYSYGENYGAGYKHESSLIEYFKDHIDYLYGFFDADRGDTARDHSKWIECINFYDLVIVIEKHDKTLTHKSPYRTGDWRYHEEPNKNYG